MSEWCHTAVSFWNDHLLAQWDVARPSAVMEEGWKPLKVSHRPARTPHSATGRVAITVQGEIGSTTPKNTATLEARSSGGPLGPVRSSARGTRPDLYTKVQNVDFSGDEAGAARPDRGRSG
jgi:hypothetical protein